MDVLIKSERNNTLSVAKPGLACQGGNKINVSVCLCVCVCVCMCVNEFLRLTFYVRWTKTYVERIFIPKTYVRHTYLRIDILPAIAINNEPH